MAKTSQTSCCGVGGQPETRGAEKGQRSPRLCVEALSRCDKSREVEKRRAKLEVGSQPCKGSYLTLAYAMQEKQDWEREERAVIRAGYAHPYVIASPFVCLSHVRSPMSKRETGSGGRTTGGVCSGNLELGRGAGRLSGKPGETERSFGENGGVSNLPRARQEKGGASLMS